MAQIVSWLNWREKMEVTAKRTQQIGTAYMATQKTAESVLLVWRTSPIDSKYHVSLPFSSILLHHLRPTRILHKKKHNRSALRIENTWRLKRVQDFPNVYSLTFDYLPSCDILNKPEVDCAQNDDDQEAECLVVDEQTKDKVAGQGCQFECNVQHAVTWVRCTLKEPWHVLLALLGAVCHHSVVIVCFHRRLNLRILRSALSAAHRVDLSLSVVADLDLEIKIAAHIVL